MNSKCCALKQKNPKRRHLRRKFEVSLAERIDSILQKMKKLKQGSKLPSYFKLPHDLKRVQIQRVVTGRHFAKYRQVVYQNGGQNMNINLAHILIKNGLNRLPYDEPENGLSVRIVN